MRRGCRKKLCMDNAQRVLDQIWKVYEGFGMVLLHSESVADLVYNNGVELVWAACKVVMDAYGIVKIWRFRDDILVLASERFTSNANGRGLIQRASYFITKCAAKANTRFLKDSRSAGT